MSSMLLTAGPWKRLLSPFLGSLVGGWLLFKYFPEAPKQIYVKAEAIATQE